MLPECPVCYRNKHTVEAQRRGELERQRMLGAAWTSFNKLRASGSGVSSFDEAVKTTFGEWK